MNNTIFRVGDEVEIIYGYNNGKTGKITKKCGSQFYTDVDGHVYDHDELKLINCKIETDADKMRALLVELTLIACNGFMYTLDNDNKLLCKCPNEKHWGIADGSYLFIYRNKVYHEPTKNESLKKEMQELQETINKAQKRCDEINERMDK